MWLFLKENGRVIQLEVGGIRCTQCEATIKIALRNLPDVHGVNILKKKIVRVELQPQSTLTPEELSSVINQTGYCVVNH